MDIVVVHALIAAGLLGVSLWWYRHNLGDKSGNAGCALWILWVVFGALSLAILATSEAVLFGGIVTWVFCLAGTVLGSRLLARAFRSSEDAFWALTTVFAAGSALLVFLLVWIRLPSALLSS